MSSHARVWRPEDVSKPVPAKPGSSKLFRPDILEFIDDHIEQSSQELRALSLDIHGIRDHSARPITVIADQTHRSPGTEV